MCCRYVMSDCEGIPLRAAEAFGDKVLPPSPAAIVDHIDHATSNRTHDEIVLRSTFAEHYLFSMTDFQVRHLQELRYDLPWRWQSDSAHFCNFLGTLHVFRVQFVGHVT